MSACPRMGDCFSTDCTCHPPSPLSADELEAIRARWPLPTVHFGRDADYAAYDIARLLATVDALQTPAGVPKDIQDAIVRERVNAIQVDPLAYYQDAIWDCGYCDGGYKRVDLLRDLGVTPGPESP